MNVYQGFMHCSQSAIALLAITWLFAAVGRYAVGRLEIKRKKEAEELQAKGGAWGAVTRWERRLLVLGMFGVGVVVGLLQFGWRDEGIIFCQYVPWSGIYHGIFWGVMMSSGGLAMVGAVSFPKTSRRSAVLAFAVLALSFVIHLAVAFSFWGHGMSFIACVRGFSDRFYLAAVDVLASITLFAIAIPLQFCLKPVRCLFTRYNMNCELYLGNVFRFFFWFGLLGLLVYETLILIWFRLAF